MLSRATSQLAILLVGFLGLLPDPPAQEKAIRDWPVFRGNGLQTGTADSALPDALAVTWSFKTDQPVQGSPVIFDQTVFLGALDGKLYALELASGKKKWVYQAVAIKVAPAVRDGAVFFGDAGGTFHCVDAVTGKKRWTFAAKGQIVSPANFAADKIVFGSDDHHLYCVSLEGKLVWQLKTKEKIQVAPAIAGERVFVAGRDQTLHVVDLAKGVEVATIPLGGYIGASAAVRGDQLYVGTMANRFLAVDWRKGSILWHFEAKRGDSRFFLPPPSPRKWLWSAAAISM
jgi:outer membrane protein assembly factor BamB